METRISRRRCLKTLAAIGLAGQAQHPLSALAAGQPSRAVRFVVPYAVGGTSDVIARYLGQKLTESSPYQLMVDNRPGGGTVIGASAVVHAKEAEPTILVANNTHVISPYLLPSLPYDPVKDFTPVCLLATSDYLLLARPELGITTLQEFIELAKRKPGTINFGTHGVGGLSHLAAEMMCSMAGIKLQMVPYKGAGPALNAILAGEVDVYFDAPATTLPFVSAHKLVPLAISGKHRLAQLPDTPTLAEAGVKNYDVTIWYGLLGPAGMQPALVTGLQDNCARLLRQTDVATRFKSLGATPSFLPSPEFGAFLTRESNKYREIIQNTGIAGS